MPKKSKVRSRRSEVAPSGVLWTGQKSQVCLCRKASCGLSAVFCLLFFVGCSVVELVKPEGPPSDEQIAVPYNQTELNTSGAADVLTELGASPGSDLELLSQSKSVIASIGQKKKGYKTWFNMVAFDENELTAKRKYLLIVDEKPKVLFVEPWAALNFDCRAVLPQQVINQPYANDNARRIAILRQVLADFKMDMDQVKSDNNALVTSGMLVNQAIQTVLVKLDSSPVLAGRLSDSDGLKFEHTSFDKGRIRMLVEGDIVTVKIELGSIVKRLF